MDDNCTVEITLTDAQGATTNYETLILVLAKNQTESDYAQNEDELGENLNDP